MQVNRRTTAPDDSPVRVGDGVARSYTRLACTFFVHSPIAASFDRGG